MSTYPNPVREGNYPNWKDFFDGTNHLFYHNEICDCYRTERKNEKENETEHEDFIKKVFENRYYYNHNLRLKVTYLQMLHLPLKGHYNANYLKKQFSKLIEKNDNNSQNFSCGIFDNYVPPLWECTLNDCIKNYIPHISSTLSTPSLLLPTTIIMNAGLWRSSNQEMINLTNKEYLTEFIKLAHNYLQFSSFSHSSLFPHIIWRTTSHMEDRDGNMNSDYYDEIACSVEGMTCLNVSFTKDIDNSLFSDQAHFKAPVYNAWNLQLYDIMNYGIPNNKQMKYSDKTL
eukprot:gene12449-16697_t